MKLHQTVCKLIDDLQQVEQEIRQMLPHCDQCDDYFYNVEFCEACQLQLCIPCFDSEHNPHRSHAEAKANFEANIQ